MKYDCVQQTLSRSFDKLGQSAARHPFPFIFVPVVITAILFSGIHRIKLQKDVTDLFVPDTGRAKTDKANIDELFPMNFSTNFDFGRLTRLNGFGIVLVTAKDGGSVLRKDVFSDILDLDRLINSITVDDSGKQSNYSALCAKRDNKCDKKEFEQLQEQINRTTNGRFDFKYPLEIDNKTYNTQFYGKILGGVTTDEEGYVTDAKAIRLYYYLFSDHGACSDWERAFLDTLSHSEFEKLTLAWYASVSMATEINRITEKCLPLLSVAIILMLTFGVSTCLTSDCVRSKPWLGVTGCLSSALAVGSAFGFIMYCGVTYIDINIAVPFLMLGIGMDDTFVILAAWRRTDTRDKVDKRMGEAFSEAAVSITITSVTNFVSFLIGLTTPFLAVRIFCLYTAVAVFFTYIYQITFFAGCMALSGYREERNLHPLTCLPVVPKSLAEKKSFVFRLLCTGGDENGQKGKKIVKDHSVMVLFRDRLGTALSHWPVKISVIIVFAVYLAGGIWTSVLVEEGLDYRNLYPYDSYAATFADFINKYFTKYPHRIQVIVNTTLDYSRPEVQRNMEELAKKFEECPFIADSSLTESWLKYYLMFLNMTQVRNTIALLNLNVSVKEDFMRVLDSFLSQPAAERFRDDIVFNEDRTDIVASRFIIQSADIRSAHSEKSMLTGLREIADESVYPLTVYNAWFVTFEPMLTVKETSLQAISTAAVAMMVIFLIFIPNLTCAVCVAFSIVSIETGVYGYMSAWGVKLNPVSMINLIMCIGFSVDFSSHISYCYVVSKNCNGNDRMRRALYAAGLPILQGSMSTILGVAILCFAPANVFVVFAKTVFLVMFFGATHGIFLLPVLLSLRDSIAGNKLQQQKLPSPTDEAESTSLKEFDADKGKTDSDDESGYNGDPSRESAESLQPPTV